MGVHEASVSLEANAKSYESRIKRSKRLLQNHDSLLQHVEIVLSTVASISTLWLLALWRNGEVSAHYRSIAIVSALLIFVVYSWRGVFRRSDGSTALRLMRSWTFVVALTIGLLFFSKTSSDFSRTVILGWFFCGYILQLLGCFTSSHIAHHLKLAKRKPVRAVVLGSSRIAEHLVASLNNNDWIPDQVIGVVDDAATNLQRWKDTKVAHLGTFKELRKIIDDYQISRVYLAMPISCSQIVEQLYRDISTASVDIIWVPDIFNMNLLNPSVRELNGLPLLTLSESPMMSETQLFFKSCVDKTVALLALIALSPLMIVIAFCVWYTSPGPIFFKQKRHGWDGCIIEVLKFRSMYLHDDTHVQQASKNDSRVTPIGRFIRRTSIDELPQLFNVLMGTMSLVGPRPHAVAHNGFYSQYIRSYMMRHRIKPGMTGLAQIHGCRGETETLNKMLRRVEYDIEYIDRWSLLLDLKILLKTPFSLISTQAY